MSNMPEKNPDLWAAALAWFVDRLPYINAYDKSPKNQDRNRAYRERAVFKNATVYTRNGLLGGTGRLKEIPFTFVGAQNNDPSIDESPLYDIAMINLGHYWNSAEYEDSVFWCGQAQPWISGLDEQWRDGMEKNAVYVGSRAPMMLSAGGSFGYAQPLLNRLVKEATA